MVAVLQMRLCTAILVQKTKSSKSEDPVPYYLVQIEGYIEIGDKISVYTAISQKFLNGTLSHTQCLQKNCTKLFVSELCQISANCENC